MTEEGIAFIKSDRIEGLHKLLPDGRVGTYICPAGKLTIGYGCTKHIVPRMALTVAECDALLRQELALHDAHVDHLVTVPITPRQKDALVSFDFNTGGLAGSTLLRKLNAGDTQGAARELLRWCHYHDEKTGEVKVAAGLVYRRQAEMGMLLSEDVVHLEQMPQAVMAPQQPKQLEETKTAVNAISQLSIGKGLTLGAVLEFYREVQSLGFADAFQHNPWPCVVAALGALLIGGGYFALHDRQKKLEDGI